MTRAPKRRAYDSASRLEAAALTRQAILEAARRSFRQFGYAATTMPAIAKAAGIALDTVYATVGKKPTLFRLLVETAISGADQAVPALERAYVRTIRAEPDARKKLQLYAAALGQILPRLAPLFQVLQTAAPLDPNLKALWGEISERRATHMRNFATELIATGQLRRGISVQLVADILWSMNSSEFYLLLVEQRGWSAEQFEGWLADAWQRLLIES